MTTKYDLSIPLLIYGPKHELLWTNPDMLDIMTFHDVEQDEDTSDSVEPVHRIFLDDADGNGVMRVIMFSPALDAFWEDAWRGDPYGKKHDETKLTAAVERLGFELETCFLEDTWMPGGTQFCFTQVGKRVAELWQKIDRISFSPDCMLWKDGSNTFGYDT